MGKGESEWGMEGASGQLNAQNGERLSGQMNQQVGK